ncbi:hypothetical protein ALC53_07217 [Atta colombica]|uniref:Uncharacterized protein n=1 Tax=Atta colombica TaxID=520822 RepID=A0A195BDD8_9HYME|nr:hypothetical protein ALC53_07217 [Atta colombica]
MTIHVHEWTRGVSESTRSRNGSLNGTRIEINILKSLKPMANDSILRLPAPFASAIIRLKYAKMLLPSDALSIARNMLVFTLFTTNRYYGVSSNRKFTYLLNLSTLQKSHRLYVSACGNIRVETRRDPLTSRRNRFNEVPPLSVKTSYVGAKRHKSQRDISFYDTPNTYGTYSTYELSWGAHHSESTPAVRCIKRSGL